MTPTTDDGTGPAKDNEDADPWIVRFRRELMLSDAQSRPDSITQILDALRTRRVKEIRLDIAARLENVLRHLSLADAAALVNRMANVQYSREQARNKPPDQAD